MRSILRVCIIDFGLTLDLFQQDSFLSILYVVLAFLLHFIILFELPKAIQHIHSASCPGVRSKVKDEWPHINKFPCTQACISAALADYSLLHPQDFSLTFVCIWCRFYGSLPTLTSSGCFGWYLALATHLVDGRLGGGKAWNGKRFIRHVSCLRLHQTLQGKEQALNSISSLKYLHKLRGLQESQNS